VSVLVVGLDLTILNLALPVLSTQLHASTTDLQWFSASYSLVLAAALLPAGLLGDRLGRKKMLLIALVVFGASSAACAFAGSPAELIAARAVLGLGAAVIFPMSIAVLPVLFAPDEQPRAIAIVMGATCIAYPVGPLLGGWLLDNFWWGSVFLINVPVVAIALVAVALLMPESHGARSRRIDIPGIVLSSLGLAGVTYGCIKAGANGWTDPAALAMLLAGAVVLAVFVAWERRAGRHGTALVQLELFRSASFTWGTLLATVVSFAMFGVLFATPQYFQAVEGTDAALRRGAALAGRGLVVAKAAKPGQDLRFDRPAIGPATIELLSELGATLIGVEAHQALVLERERTLERARTLNVTLYGHA